METERGTTYSRPLVDGVVLLLSTAGFFRSLEKQRLHGIKEEVRGMSVPEGRRAVNMSHSRSADHGRMDPGERAPVDNRHIDSRSFNWSNNWVRWLGHPVQCSCMTV